MPVFRGENTCMYVHYVWAVGVRGGLTKSRAGIPHVSRRAEFLQHLVCDARDTCVHQQYEYRMMKYRVYTTLYRYVSILRFPPDTLFVFVEEGVFQ